MIYKNIALIILGFLFFSQIEAQITIGSSYPANPGALLDLKEDNIVGANSKAGLLMPKVELEAKKELKPTIKDPLTDDIRKAHAGLTVFNISTILSEGLCPGLYTWNSTEWVRLYGNCGTDIQPSRPIIEVDADGFDIANPNKGVVEFTYTSSKEVTVTKTDSWYNLEHDPITKTIKVDVIPNNENLDKNGIINLSNIDGTLMVPISQETLNWQYTLTPNPIPQAGGIINLEITHNSRFRTLKTAGTTPPIWAVLNGDGVGSNHTITVQPNTNTTLRTQGYRTELSQLKLPAGITKPSLGTIKSYEFDLNQAGSDPYIIIRTDPSHYPLDGRSVHIFDVSSNVEWELVNITAGANGPTIDGTISRTTGGIGNTPVSFKTYMKTSGSNTESVVRLKSKTGNVQTNGSIIGRPVTSDLVIPDMSPRVADNDGFDKKDSSKALIDLKYISSLPITASTSPSVSWIKLTDDPTNKVVKIDVEPNNGNARIATIVLSDGEKTEQVNLRQESLNFAAYATKTIFGPTAGETGKVVGGHNSQRRIPYTYSFGSEEWLQFSDFNSTTATVTTIDNNTTGKDRQAGTFQTLLRLDDKFGEPPYNKELLGDNAHSSRIWIIQEFRSGPGPGPDPSGRGRFKYKDNTMEEYGYSRGIAMKDLGRYTKVEIELIDLPLSEFPVTYDTWAVNAGSYQTVSGVDIEKYKDASGKISERIIVGSIFLGEGREFNGSVAFFFKTATGKSYHLDYRGKRK